LIGGDVLGLILVYAYVVGMVIITDRSRFLRDRSFHRKFIHVMIGNIALFWWVFDTNYVMSLLAAVPFIPLLFIFSKYGGKREKDDSKLIGDLKGSVLSTASHDGHKLGLVYYAISWALLAFFAFNDLVIASVGIVCMAYGDGMGGLVGKTFGKRKIHGNKTLEGTLAVFIFAALAIFLMINYYNLLYSMGLYGTRSIPLTISALTAVGLSVYVAVVELYTPGEYDNLVIPLSTALIMFMAGI